MDHPQTIGSRGLGPLALVKGCGGYHVPTGPVVTISKGSKRGSWMDTPKDRTPGSGHRGLVMISKSGSQDPTMIMMTQMTKLGTQNGPPPDHGFGRSCPRPTTMSEGLTDQTSIAMDSCHVLMGVEDTCLGPPKKGSKKGPKMVIFGVPNPGSHDLRRSRSDLSMSICLLYTSPSPRDYAASRMPSSA